MNKEHKQLGDAAMQMALRGLRRDIEPGHDLWPGIAARLPLQSQQSAQVARGSRPGWLWPLGLAASMLLAVGLVWQMKPFKQAADVGPLIAGASSVTPSAIIDSETLVQREADSMTVHYESALREMELEQLPVGWQAGLDVLDHSAFEIRNAMRTDPNSRLLLERLRATYTRRLVLARRALYA